MDHDLDVRAKTMKLLKKDMGLNFNNLRLDFLIILIVDLLI